MRPVALSLLGLALAVTCCGSPGETVSEMPAPAAEATVEAPEATTAESEPETAEPEGCGMVFTPVPELLEATEAAAARWSPATGCDVRVDEGGLPVVVLDDVINLEGESKNARTTFKGEPGAATPLAIEVRRDIPRDFGRVMVHEMGHALGGHGHTDSGVMKGKSEAGAPIDALSLSLVCENLSCVAFVPEG